MIKIIIALMSEPPLRVRFQKHNRLIALEMEKRRNKAKDKKSTLGVFDSADLSSRHFTQLNPESLLHTRLPEKSNKSHDCILDSNLDNKQRLTFNTQYRLITSQENLDTLKMTNPSLSL